MRPETKSNGVVTVNKIFPSDSLVFRSFRDGENYHSIFIFVVHHKRMNAKQ